MQVYFNRPETLRKIQIYVWPLILVKFIFIALASFNSLVGPHIHRQSDTLGVAFRYWQKFSLEGISWQALLPSVLHSGNGSGIMPMEFPFINIVLSPFFSIPIENPIPFVMAVYLLITLLFYFINFKVWKNIEIMGVSQAPIMALLPLLSVFAYHGGKLLPDVWAALFVSIALGLVWNGQNRVKAVLIATLGLLIKPVVIVIFFILLVKPFKECLTKYWWIVLVPFLCAVLYYKFGMNYLKSVGESGNFYVAIRSFWLTIPSFFAKPDAILYLFNELIVAKFVLFVMAVAMFFNRTSGGKLLLIPLLQISSLVFIMGDSLFAHQYYFLGTVQATTLLLIFVTPMKKYFWIPIAALLLIRTGDIMVRELKPISEFPKKRIYQYRSNCLDLKRLNPNFPWGQGYIFRSKSFPFPRLALCFLERAQSDNARFGFSMTDEKTPSGCRDIDSRQFIKIFDCVDEI